MPLSKEKRNVSGVDLRFEGITPGQMDEIKGYVGEIFSALFPGDLGLLGGDDHGRRWFGSYWTQAKVRADIMRKYLETRCNSLTFVRKMNGAKCDNCLVENVDYGQVLPNVVVNSQGKTGVQDFTQVGAELHVPRGLRIYLSPMYFSDKSTLERRNTVFHEMSHKIINTSDDEYGWDDCLDLAKANSAAALTCADNYGYWLSEYCEEWK